jgi:large subunit ribosomal protein L15
MNELSRLKKPRGSTHRKKRVGRGQASGLGKTAGRGGKGQKARTGNMNFEGFEGGQMPLQRRLPKRGFVNPFRKEFSVVNVGALEAKFDAGATVDPDALLKAGVISRLRAGVKVLGEGELAKKLTVKAHRFSAQAKEKIEKAGGTAELIAAAAAAAPAA